MQPDDNLAVVALVVGVGVVDQGPAVRQMDQRQSLGPPDQQAAVVPDPEWPPVVEAAGVVEPAEVEADSS